MIDKIFEEWAHRMYFKRDGTPYNNALEWSKDFENFEANRRIDKTELWWGGSVSTVWLGLNHSYKLDGPPLIFESMVFSRRGTGDLDMDRYSTEAQAREGHKRMVKKWTWLVRPLVEAIAWKIELLRMRYARHRS